MKLGAFDFVKKPFELDELLATAQNAVKAAALERRVAYHAGRDRNKLEATAVSGQPVPVPDTPSAASSTARLPRTSLRVQIHAERMFASPAR